MYGQITVDEFNLIKAALAQAKLYKADVGNIQHGVEFTDGFTPLVAQDLDYVWTSETFDDEDLVLTNMLCEMDVDSPLHEFVTVTRYGQEEDIEGFFAEGGVTELEQAELNRRTARIKYLGVQRRITDPAMMTGIIGKGMVSKRGLQEETDFGMESLKGRYETALFHGDESLNPLQWDGLIRQIETGADPRFYTNAAGTSPTLRDIVRRIFKMADRPYFGKVNTVLMTSDQLGQMIDYAQAYQQWRPGDAAGPNKALKYNAGALTIIGPGGREIPIKAAPKMKLEMHPSRLTGSVGRIANLVLGNITIDVVAGPPSFDAEEQGDYHYVVVARGDTGMVAHTYASAVTVGADQRVRFTIDDAAFPKASTDDAAGIRYYSVYRTKLDAAAPTEIEDVYLLGRFARNEDGGGDATVFFDDGSKKPGSGHILLLTNNRKSIFVAKFLGTVRRPLAEVKTARPFMIMRFVKPHIRHPKRMGGWYGVPDELDL